MSRPVLFLADLPGQASAFESLKYAGPTIRLAAAPHAEREWRLIGRQFERPECYLPHAEIERLGATHFPLVERLCEALDELSARAVPYVDAYRLRPATFNFYALKMLYDSVVLRAHRIHRILDEVDPVRVVAFRPPASSIVDDLYWHLDSVWARVMQAACEARGVAFDALPWPVAALPRPAILDRARARLAASLRDKPLLRSTMSIARQTGSVPRLRAPRWGGEDRIPRILLAGTDYNLAWLAAHLARLHQARVDLWDPRGLVVPLGLGRAMRSQAVLPVIDNARETLDELAEGTVTRGAFRVGATDLFDIVAPRLGHQVVQVAHTAALCHAHASDLLARSSPSAVVFATLTRVDQKALAVAAREAGIPVVVSPHGAYGAYDSPFAHYNDIHHADWYLAFGPGMACALARYPHGAGFGAPGAPFIDTGGRGETPPAPSSAGRRVPTIVYGTTALDHNYWYAARRVTSDSEQYRIHRQILATIARIEGIDVVLKTHPASGLVGERASPIELDVPEEWPHVRLAKARHFAEVIRDADVIVLDLPSTTLLQAVETEASIYVFNDVIEWDRKALAALRRRAFVSADLDEFCQRLERDLINGAALQRIPRDATFREGFSVPVRGRATQLLADDVLAIANGGAPATEITTRMQTPSSAGSVVTHRWRSEL